ncbi:hypothetical protein G647_03912 [Cladophialophora carrionii CBS 160.54]|uniref:Major facilitator superfamily (MFS) profile domain-containing protein n=1 Tax=Cladophialophora carrionii CBS 160.54 TaxID=1279043 RepID=V9DDY8_9EURO|nr:uncharacterized protein G647_03912 [Cladophialophora carrionii CBS 160.54]ETI24543.1 hypothetical protein G647_03912 [Cladophialophora carrionii CBS 160.54]
MLQKLYSVITTGPREAIRGRRMVRGPVEKSASLEGLLAILNDRDRINDQLRSQLAGFDREELAEGIRSIKRLLDCCLIAMAWAMFACNYFDRSCLAAAELMGLRTDLSMNSNEYGLAMMLMFIAYVLAQVPSNLYLAKGRPSIYLPTAMVLWGSVCTSTAFVRTPGALYAARSLLGLLEAPFSVGCLFLISSWYTRTELGLRSAILLSAPMMANAFTGVIAFGIHDSVDGAYGLEGWRWLFIVGGSVTIIIACIAFFTLPDYPHNTRWLYEEERALAQLRLIADRGASEYDVSRVVGLKMAFNSWQVWTFAGMYFLLAIGASLHNFFPSVVQTLGFSRNTTLWMTAPPYLLAVVVAISAALSADRLRNASSHIIGTTALAIVGFLMFLLEQSTGRRDVWARYASTFLMIAGAHAANPIVLGWAQKTVRQPREMRATAIAIVNTSGTIAQIATSELYPKRWAPRYIQSMSLNTACALAAVLLAIFMREALRRANKKLDLVGNAVGGEAQTPGPSNNEQRQGVVSTYRYVT